MILLFLPALLTMIVMLVISMAPIFHFAPTEKGKQWRFRAISRLTAMRVRKGGAALQEQVTLEQAALEQAA